jgi:4-hydroxybenzoate polyprenyltransferase
MKLIKAADFIFLLRPIILIPFWSFLLMGYLHAQDYWAIRFSLNSKLLFIMLIATAIMGIIYILNQISDRQSDAINKKLYFIPKNIITVKQAYGFCLLLCLCSILALVLLKISLVTTLFIIAILPLGMLYSLPPIRLKARPVLDTLMNAVGYGWVAFSIGWLAGSSFSSEITIQAVPYMLAVAAMHINTTLIDAAGDRQSGYRTTGIWLGKKKAALLSLICILLVIISSILLHSWVCLVTAVISLPVYCMAYYKQTGRWITLSLHIPGRVFVILVGIIFPYYLIFLILLYAGTRWYYKKRFNMTYPAIK